MLLNRLEVEFLKCGPLRDFKGFFKSSKSRSSAVEDYFSIFY